MACFLMAPSHHLNQCWLIISEVQLTYISGNFTRDASSINHSNLFENYISKLSFKLPRGQWVNAVYDPWHLIISLHHNDCIYFRSISGMFTATSMWLSDTIWHQTTSLTHWPLGDFNKILENEFFKLILVTGGCDISSEISLRWTSLDLNDVNIGAGNGLVPSGNKPLPDLSQCWPSSLSPYGVTRPQWANIISGNVLSPVRHLAANYSEFLIDGLMQERRTSIANALELYLSCISSSMYAKISFQKRHLKMRSAKCWLFCSGLHSLKPGQTYEKCMNSHNELTLYLLNFSEEI